MRWLPWTGPIIFLGVALLDLPYGYYQLLRVAVFLVALFHLWQSIERSEQKWAWAFGGIALIYNPVASLHLGRDIWTVVNIVTIAVLALHGWHVLKGDRSSPPAA